MSGVHAEMPETGADARPCTTALTEINGDVHKYFDVYHEIGKLGSKFWGIDTGNANVPYPQTPENKAKDLRRVLRKVDDLSPAMATWARKTNEITPRGATAFLQREVDYPENVAGVFVNLPSTAIEAYKQPSVRDLVYKDGLEEGDPIVIVVEGFERLLTIQPYSAIPARARHVGTKALELFAFTAGGTRFSKKVTSTARGYYVSEQQRLAEIEKTREARST